MFLIRMKKCCNNGIFRNVIFDGIYRSERRSKIRNLRSSVSDPHKKNADPDPDTGLQKNADPDPGIAKFDKIYRRRKILHF